MVYQTFLYEDITCPHMNEIRSFVLSNDSVMRLLTGDAGYKGARARQLTGMASSSTQQGGNNGNSRDSNKNSRRMDNSVCVCGGHLWMYCLGIINNCNFLHGLVLLFIFYHLLRWSEVWSSERIHCPLYYNIIGWYIELDIMCSLSTKMAEIYLGEQHSKCQRNMWKHKSLFGVLTWKNSLFSSCSVTPVILQLQARVLKKCIEATEAVQVCFCVSSQSYN